MSGHDAVNACFYGCPERRYIVAFKLLHRFIDNRHFEMGVDERLSDPGKVFCRGENRLGFQAENKLLPKFRHDFR